MWPLLLRELRLEARRPFNRWLRIGAAVLFFLVLLGGLERATGLGDVGRRVFPPLHGLLLLLPWAVAPTLAAEVIARERRTGMLEQLQLTRVTWGAIIRSITLSIIVRTVTLMLAAFPMLGLAVLFGSVGRQELEFAALLQALSLLMALTVALLSGTLGRTWGGAMVWVLGMGGCLGGGASALLFAAFQNSIAPSLVPKLWPAPESAWVWVKGMLRLLGDVDLAWGPTLAVLPTSVIDSWRQALIQAVGAAALAHLVAGPVAAWLLRRGLRGEANRAAVRRVESGSFWLPAAVPAAVRRRWLRGNPVRWLMRYPAETRWARGAMAMLVFAVEAALFGLRVPFSEWLSVQVVLLVLLAGSMALSAAESFRRERASGALELLLVTPLRPRDLSFGRLGGLWWTFGPAAVVWGTALWVAVPILRSSETQVALFLWGGALFAAIPAVGLEAAFQFRGYWRAAVATLGLTLGLSGGLFWLGCTDDAEFWVTGLDLLILGVLGALSLPGFEQRFTRHRNGEPPPPFQFRPEPIESPYAAAVRGRSRIPVSRFRQR